MSELRLRTLANFATAAEAGALQSALEMQSIPCALTNVETVGNLWHLSNAVGGISVQVAEQDWEAAQAVLNAAPIGEPWVCPACGARVDAGFDICWRCSADPQLMEVGADDTVDGQAASVEPRRETVVLPSDAQALPRAEIASTNAVEELSRAWKCAAIGVWLLGLPNVYSLLLLFGKVNFTELPSDIRWKWIAVFIADVLVLAFLWTMLQTMLT